LIKISLKINNNNKYLKKSKNLIRKKMNNKIKYKFKKIQRSNLIKKNKNNNNNLKKLVMMMI